MSTSPATERPSERTVSISSQGCKINQYEGQELREELNARGWRIVPFGGPSAVTILNTCTVTGQADFKARNLVRRARRSNPDTRLVVTGCYAQTNPEDLEAMDEVDVVVGNSDKLRIPSLLDGILEDDAPSRLVTSWDACSNFEGVDVHHFSGRNRAFLKIQDGCNQFCSFCIIPFARGRSRSRDPRSVSEQLVRLRASGYREIVLTGIHLGQYGLDLEGEWTLTRLVRSILPRLGDARIRLSSTEVGEVSDELIDLVACEERVCPHFHIPLQCADDQLLAAMNRPYDAAAYARRIEAIARRIDRFGLGADVIVGFPGETDAAYDRTERFVRELPFTYLHVFPYSPRTGTAAAGLRDRVDPRVRKERGRRMRNLGREKTRAFALGAVGSTARVLLESRDEKNARGATSEDYCRILVEGDLPEAGELFYCRVDRYEGGALMGLAEAAAGAPRGPRAPARAASSLTHPAKKRIV
jgi:threonylcarbamoyladenosine tRNA methylthiotransferase MtaB